MIDARYLNKKWSAGELVKFRGRTHVVMPNSDPEINLLKPLGASDDETTAVFSDITLPHDFITGDKFDWPTKVDISNFQSAKLLFNATKLSFRSGSGPFRCMGKLSFRPRSYQLVPLIMALRQPVTRLLIADDVGVGKTIEALLILRELMERGEVKRFAVICLPHLCDQWQREIQDKLHLDAVIIRSSTVRGLENDIVGGGTIFTNYHHQIISIDYLKNDGRKSVFLSNEECPDLIIVDEAHSCAKPKGQTPAQMQRYHLMHELSKLEGKHLVLLTATPHSGKEEEFKSLLGLVKPELEDFNLTNLDTAKKKLLASHFIQRKRDDLKLWKQESGTFPERDPKELGYELSDDYRELYKEVLRYAQGLIKTESNTPQSRMKHWAILALLRGIMSSPAAGLDMLANRQYKTIDEESLAILDAQARQRIIEQLQDTSDDLPDEILDAAGEMKTLQKLKTQLQLLQTREQDVKLGKCIDWIQQRLKDGKNPIVFCRFISTAKYVAAKLREYLPNASSVDIRAITSELSDEERKEKIDEMGTDANRKRVLVATDCLSEGINLQHHFNAVLHYDLPWNPNRIEQREGRVDRFGQRAKEIPTVILWGEDNPIDVVVMDTLLKKIGDIKKNTGIQITLGEDNQAIMDRMLHEILENPFGLKRKDTGKQLSLLSDEKFTGSLGDIDAQLTSEIIKAEEQAKQIRSIFAHTDIQPGEVEEDMLAVDEAIGDVATVRDFVTQALQLLGAQVLKEGEDRYKIVTGNMDEYIFDSLKPFKELRISFASPTLEGYRYVGRNHRFVELLCHKIMNCAFDTTEKHRVARASVFPSESVEHLTTLLQFRVRNVIREANKTNETVTEEMFLWAYTLKPDGMKILSPDEAKKLFQNASAFNISRQRQEEDFEREIERLESLTDEFTGVAKKRALLLVEAHSKFGKYLGAKRYEAVQPVLPPDVMGMYVLLPQPKN